MLKIYDLQIEYKNKPIGLDEKNPAFSWKIKSDKKNAKQEKCKILVYHKENIVYDSGLIIGDQTLYHEYRGEKLLPETDYKIKIFVWDNYGNKAEEESEFETGLLEPDNMLASFITHGFEDDMEEAAIFKHRFEITKKVVKARAYVSALGIYKLELNGQRVGDMRFAPGWTSYQERLQYQTYDITEFISQNNKIEITVGNGWWKGILGFYGHGCHYGKRTAVIAQIRLRYEDGSTDVICTDESWKSTTGPIRNSEFYHGEVIDFNIPAQETRQVMLFDYPKKNLISQVNEPVRITERLCVKNVIQSPNGETILDFGQNMSGVVKAKLHLSKGTKVTLRYSELLDENGNLFTTNLRTAKATDTFISSGKEDVFLPEFTSHGFRYVAVEGIDVVDPDCFTACVHHTDYKRETKFECSNKEINQVWNNIDWTMRSNFVDIPTDCPQRDERLGYTGDIEIFLPTALNYGNLALFFRKWLRDLKVEQSDIFGVPLSVPDILKTHACVNIWHDAAAIVPWLVYEKYGDIRVLKEQYDSILRSVEYTRKLAGNGLLQIENISQFGDWLALDAPKGPFRLPPEGELRPSMDEKAGGTDPYLIGNVYYLYSINILKKSASLLGKQEDALKYQKLYDDILCKFQNEYITPGGRLLSETQTAAALVLYFDLAKEEDREKILNKLILNLIKTQKHLRTGFVGTEYLPHVLSRFNKHQLAGDILLKEECPSWLYEIKLGATTIWELWDGMNPDHSINPFAMNSFNQFGFGTIGDWLMKELAGLKSLEPGYKKSQIAPHLVKGINNVSASYETPYGKLFCQLSCKDNKINADIIIPANTECDVYLPGRKMETLGSGTYHYEYYTELSFEQERYTEDSILRDLLSHKEAMEYFEEKAPKLAHDPFVRNFAGKLSIIEIKMTIPETMVPKSAYPIFDEMIEILNKKERK